MLDKSLNEIKEFAVKKLNLSYGYCGCADAPTQALLNSTDRNGNDIVISIQVKEG